MTKRNYFMHQYFLVLFVPGTMLWTFCNKYVRNEHDCSWL